MSMFQAFLFYVVDYNYAYTLQSLKLHTLQVRRQHVDAPFLIHVF
jgi:hypothetical protein